MLNHAYVLSTVATSLAKCKCAHGGISTANVYPYEDRGIVSGFQYMKEMNENINGGLLRVYLEHVDADVETVEKFVYLCENLFKRVVFLTNAFCSLSQISFGTLSLDQGRIP